MRFAKQLLVAVGLLSLLPFCLTGCGRGVAKVNRDTIPRKEYYDRLERMTVNTGAGQPQQVGEIVLQQMIQEKLKLQIADKEKVTATEKQVDTRLDMLKRLNKYQPLKDAGYTDDEIRKAARVDQSWLNFTTKGVNVAEKECAAYYKKEQARQFTTPAHIQWGVIAALTEKKARGISNQLKKKGQEFTTVAVRQSDVPELRARGGRMDPIPADIPANYPLPPGVKQALKTLKPGQISDPIYVPGTSPNERGAWFIVKVYDRRDKEVRAYRAVRDLIRDQLLMQKAGVKYANLGRKQGSSPGIKYERFIKDSKVKINIRRYAGLWTRTLNEVDYLEEARKSAADANSPTVAPSP